jgi:hypothetical protein
MQELLTKLKDNNNKLSLSRNVKHGGLGISVRSQVWDFFGYQQARLYLTLRIDGIFHFLIIYQLFEMKRK